MDDTDDTDTDTERDTIPVVPGVGTFAANPTICADCGAVFPGWHYRRCSVYAETP